MILQLDFLNSKITSYIIGLIIVILIMLICCSIHNKLMES